MLSTAQLSFVSIFPTLYVCYWCFACWLCHLMIKGHEHIQRLLCIFLTLLSSAGCCFIIIITQSKCKAVSSSWQIHPFICMKCHVMECFLCSSFWILLCLITSSREGSGTPTPALLPGKSHGQRSLGGCSQWGREESDTTERLYFHFSLSCIEEGNGTPLQRSCLENPRDGGAWWAAIYGVAQSRTRLKRLSSRRSPLEALTFLWLVFVLIQLSLRSTCPWLYIKLCFL